MLGLSFSHILFLFVLGLILIGPKQLPEVARTLGRLINDLRRQSNMFTDQFNAQMRELDHQNYIQPNQDQSQHAHHQAEETGPEQLSLTEQPNHQADSNPSQSGSSQPNLSADNSQVQGLNSSSSLDDKKS